MPQHCIFHTVDQYLLAGRKRADTNGHDAVSMKLTGDFDTLAVLNKMHLKST